MSIRPSIHNLAVEWKVETCVTDVAISVSVLAYGNGGGLETIIEFDDCSFKGRESIVGCSRLWRESHS